MVPPTKSRPSASVVIPVFRDAQRAIALVNDLSAGDLESGLLSEIIVVDDGSGDETPSLLQRNLPDSVQLIILPSNRGRSAARNAGATHASGEHILFIDCDCLPLSPQLISSHLSEWDESVSASIGPVLGNGEGFWHRYQEESSERRRRQHAAGIIYSGSSQNMMVRRSAFVECGGFDEAYRTYGFEDRDIQIRLLAHGPIRWAENAKVRHMDSLSLQDVSSKMTAAGGNAAEVFSLRFPEAYRALGYARLDARLHPILQRPSELALRVTPHLARIIDRWLDTRWLPFAARKLMVKTVTALSYLAGSSTRTISER